MPSNTAGLDIDEARNAQQRYIQGSGDQIKTSILPESSSFIGSERYRLLHKRYHNSYQELFKRSDFDDIFTGRHTVTSLIPCLNMMITFNLVTGKYKDSNLGLTFQRLQRRKRKT